jgi:hypothetical protein
MVGYIICGIAISIAAIVIIRKKIIESSREKEYSDWQVGDQISLYRTDKLFSILGWEQSGFYIEKEGSTNKIDWEEFHFNKSAIWRRNHQACEKAMGKDPGFAPGLGAQKNISGQIDGKPIDLLSETECQVYLKQALDSENYELAERIKKQMEKYR